MATLQDIRTKVRRVTARYRQDQLTDAQIDNYINTFYLYELPENFRTLNLFVPFVFYTTPNVACYDFPYQPGFTDPNGNPSPGYLNIKTPIFCQGYQLRYFQDKSMFYAVWPKRTQVYQIGVGDGTTGPYAGIMPFTPMIRADQDIFGKVTESNVIISAQQSGYVFLATDSPNQTISGVTGTPYSPSDTGSLISSGQTLPNSFVNYVTGEYQFETSNPIPSGVPINVQAIPYMPSRPVDVLFFNQQLTFRPIPTDVFQVEIQAMVTPTQLLTSIDKPLLDEWWQYLALGASKLVYTDFPDPEGLQYCLALLQEQMQLVQRRTLVQLSTQRAQTLFSTQYKQQGPGYFLPNIN